MIFCLVLIVAGMSGGNEPNSHHSKNDALGNFTSYADCEKFAAGCTTPVKSRNSPPQITMLCIQANQVGTQPPAY